MRHKPVPVKNVRSLAEAGAALCDRPPGQPGIGCVYGRTGDGKTTAIAWWASNHHGIYVRALSLWSPRDMLDELCGHLSIERGGTNGATVKRIVDRLSQTMRPLVIDEADYIVDRKNLMETLRDIHDLSSTAIIMVGMANFARRLASRYGQFSNRVAQWVEFQPATVADARLLADELCDVRIEDDLVAKLTAEVGGSVRKICTALDKIERFARTRGADAVGAAAWGSRPLSFDDAAARLRGDHLAPEALQ